LGEEGSQSKVNSALAERCSGKQKGEKWEAKASNINTKKPPRVKTI